ncbi:ABC transporter permease [Lentilitoribacter sp. EG35]|jgi:fructose transport system permease protein|uniref:ABC transporter permease n=1 Tax=Lentilitoribacter sp. EG35 TaxID=3234192 RepID=UPI00345F359A
MKEPAVSRTGLVRVTNFLMANPTMIPLGILGLAVLIFAFMVGDRFFHPFNLSLVLKQVTIIAMVGLAQTLIILTAGIDLSVGAIMVLSSIAIGRLALVNGLPPELALLTGVAVGGGCGLFNGSLVTLLRLPPFIVTLGTWSIFSAIIQFWSKGETLRSQDVEAQASLLQWAGQTFSFGSGSQIMYGSAIMVLTALLLLYMLRSTPMGRHIYAVGDDIEASRLSGINSTKVILFTYTLAGVICGVAGWLLIGRIGAVSPLSGGMTNLDSITAVVIGGTSLFGGRGAILGTMIGALIVGVFQNGLALAGLDVLWQEFTIGFLIIIAVALDQRIRGTTT